MRPRRGAAWLGVAAGLLAVPAALGDLNAASPDRSVAIAADSRTSLPPQCESRSGAETYCLYRSPVPSSGVVAVCRDDRDCRVGYYYGDPAAPVWLRPPAPLTTLPRPDVTWATPTLGQIHFACGPACSVSYFLEVKRHRLSEPRWSVLALDHRRLLLAQAEGRALVVRQMYSGREVLRIERDWAPAPFVGDAIERISFDPDGRLSLRWLRGPARTPTDERITVPSFARP